MARPDLAAVPAVRLCSESLDGGHGIRSCGHGVHVFSLDRVRDRAEDQAAAVATVSCERGRLRVAGFVCGSFGVFACGAAPSNLCVQTAQSVYGTTLAVVGEYAANRAFGCETRDRVLGGLGDAGFAALCDRADLVHLLDADLDQFATDGHQWVSFCPLPPSICDCGD